MKYYIAFLKEREVFNPSRHCREDKEVLSLEIIHQEGEFPLAEVVISSSRWEIGGESPGGYVLISWDLGEGPQVGFYGRMVTIPLRGKGRCVKFQLTAEPENSQKLLEKMHEDLKEDSHWDPLFVSQENLSNPSESLEARGALYQWSREGDLSLCPLFETEENSRAIGKVGKNFYEESLALRLCQIPLSSVHVTLSAEWIQQGFGQGDIAPFIESHFPEGRMSTLTPHYFKRSWPPAGFSLGRSGYVVLESELEEVFPSSSLEGEDPCQTPPFWHQEKVDGKPEAYRLPRSWWRGCLRIGWNYKQKRREKVTFTLFQKVQSGARMPLREKKLVFTLRSVATDRPLLGWVSHQSYRKGDKVLFGGKLYECLQDQEAFSSPPLREGWRSLGWSYGLTHPAQSSFFLTDRGRKAIGHALDRAKAYLAASSRAVEIEFMGSWKILASLQIHQILQLEDPRLPGGRARGRVVAYKMKAHGPRGEFFIQVTLLCAIGDPCFVPEKKEGRSEESYGEKGSWDSEYLGEASCLYKSEEGIEFLPYEHQTPQEGLLSPADLKGRALLGSIQIENPASQQIFFLKENQYPKNKNLRSLLQQVPTRLRFRLRSLEAKPLLEHTISITPLKPWYPPAEILLKIPQGEKNV